MRCDWFIRKTRRLEERERERERERFDGFIFEHRIAGAAPERPW